MPEIFPDSVVKEAFIRSDGECECIDDKHNHSGRCNSLITYRMRGMEFPGGWEAYQITVEKPLDASNCRIVCIDCYKAGK
jgi:hypothetical protein